MKYIFTFVLVIGLLFGSLGISIFGNVPEYSAQAYSGIPTFSIVKVVAGKSVTIKTHNFPAGDTFKVLMNNMGTRGVNGYHVATISSGSGGSFTDTYTIPAALKGNHQIAIRFQSTTGSGYFAYNWFNNKGAKYGTGGAYKSKSGYYGHPYVSIVNVVKNKNVTIKITNLPKNDSYKVLMNTMGTKGVNGTNVGTFNSGAGGTQTMKVKIPASLKGKSVIAIRVQSTSGTGYYTYNWFSNSTY